MLWVLGRDSPGGNAHTEGKHMKTVTLRLEAPSSAVRAMQINPQLGLDAVAACIDIAHIFGLRGQTLPLGFDAEVAKRICEVVNSSLRDHELKEYFNPSPKQAEGAT
jgi:hypothetical protein